MKTIDLNLSDYTLAQKLQLLETLWDDITRAGSFDSPEWHDAVLKDRQKAYDTDKLTSSDWQQAKKRIKKNLACE
ncbi:MAG TPA: addiction module protein [Candidatus Ozemobacteraceae bacterium]|nr:addiction module protein [Candidatus Ozemobacteraceae bacterium]